LIRQLVEQGNPMKLRKIEGSWCWVLAVMLAVMKVVVSQNPIFDIVVRIKIKK
jgi:hypothetical protein